MHVESTDRLDSEKALFIDMRDQETDLVRMRREHDFRAAGAFPNAGNIAERIDRDLVADRPQLVTHLRGNLSLSPRDAGRLAESLEQFDIQIGHAFLLCIANGTAERNCYESIEPTRRTPDTCCKPSWW